MSSWDAKVGLIPPTTYVNNSDDWHVNGHGGPIGVQWKGKYGNALRLFYTGKGTPKLNSSNIDISTWAKITGKSYSDIYTFFSMDHYSIGISEVPEKVLEKTTTETLYGVSAVVPSYPFESHGTTDLYDPYVIPSQGGGSSIEKIVIDPKLGEYYPSTSENFTFWAWVVWSDYGTIAQYGDVWRLYADGDYVKFSYLDWQGERRTLSLFARRGEHSPTVSSSVATSQPRLICCGPGLLAISDLRDSAEYLRTYQVTTVTPRKMTVIRGSQLTLGNSWKGGDSDKFGGAIIAAKISFDKSPTGTGLQEDGSLFYYNLDAGPRAIINDTTTWAIEANRYDGSGLVHDLIENPYNVYLLGDTDVREFVLSKYSATGKKESYILYNAPTEDDKGYVYFDIVDYPYEVVKRLGPESGYPPSQADSEEDDMQDSSVALVLDNGSDTEIVYAYAWESLGEVATYGENGRIEAQLIRIYISSLPSNNFSKGDSMFMYINSEYYTVRAIKCVYNSNNDDGNYFTYGYVKKPEPHHDQRMVFVGYDSSTGKYSILEGVVDGYNADCSLQQRPIYRSSNKIRTPVLVEVGDNSYVLFAESGKIWVLFKKKGEIEWEKLPNPILEPGGTDWDASDVVLGGIYSSDKRRGFTITYAGYDGTDWRAGTAKISNLISPARDTLKSSDPISGDDVTLYKTDYYRPVGNIVKLGNNYYIPYTQDGKMQIAKFTWESGEGVGDFEDLPDPYAESELVNRVRELAHYKKQDGRQYLLAVIGKRCYRGLMVLRDGKVVTEWTGLVNGGDIPSDYLFDDKEPVVTAASNEWLYIAHHGDPLCRWAGGKIKKVGVEAPEYAPTVTATTGSLANGEYSYVYTYYTTYGESNPSPANSNTGTGFVVTWTAPASSVEDIVGVKVYRKGPSDTEYMLVHTESNITTTTWTDDGTVDPGAAAPDDHDTPPELDGVVPYNTYLFGWKGQVVYWSKGSLHLYWPTGNNKVLDSNGEHITGMVVLGHQLLVFTATSVFAITPAGQDTSGNIVWGFRKTRATIGTTAGKTIKVVSINGQNVVMYLGSDGHIWVHNGESSQNITAKKIGGTISQIEKGYIKFSCAGIHEDENGSYYVCCVPIGSNVPNTIISLDLSTLAFSLHTNQHIGVMDSVYHKTVGRILLGGDSRRGFIYQMYDGEDDAGEPIVMRLRTKHFDFGEPSIYKRVRKIYYDITGNDGQAYLSVGTVEDEGGVAGEYVSIPGYTIMLFLPGPKQNELSLFSPDFNVLGVTGQLGTIKDDTSDTATPLGDALSGLGKYMLPEIEFDNDRYIALPEYLSGKEIYVELVSGWASSDFALDSLSLLVRGERQK